MQTIDRVAFIKKAAEVTAQCLYDIHEGRGDTSMVNVNGMLELKPFIPLISQVGGRPNAHTTSISDNAGNWIDLSVTEEEDLKNFTDACLADMVRNKLRGVDHDSPEAIFEAGKQLMGRAQRVGLVLLISMNTVKQQKINKSKDFVIVAPYDGQGPTLMTPEPSTTGQRYDG